MRSRRRKVAGASQHFSGGAGIIAIVLAMGFASVRFMGMSDVNDPALLKDLQMRVAPDQSGDFLQSLERGREQGDFTEAVEGLQRLSNPAVVHKVSVSSSLLSYSNSEDVVVRVEYSIPRDENRKREVRYYRYIKRAIGAWQYRSVSTSGSYYLNFF
jgi:hypothetical protein